MHATSRLFLTTAAGLLLLARPELSGQEVRSPNRTLAVKLSPEAGRFTYEVACGSRTVIEPDPRGVATLIEAAVSGKNLPVVK